MKFLTAILVVFACSCAALGIGQPTVATNQCFAYCLDVPVQGEVVAWCYKTQAQQQKALAALKAQHVPAQVHK